MGMKKAAFRLLRSLSCDMGKPPPQGWWLRCRKSRISAALSRRLVLWQAWRSPASLGLPLSVPSACGCHEIVHLKEPLYSTVSIAVLFGFVKDFLGAQITPISLFLNFQECDHRVFIPGRVSFNGKPHDQLKTLAVLQKLFEQKSRIGFIRFQNIIRVFHDPCYVLRVPFKVVRMAVFDMLYPLVGIVARPRAISAGFFAAIEF